MLHQNTIAFMACLSHTCLSVFSCSFSGMVHSSSMVSNFLHLQALLGFARSSHDTNASSSIIFRWHDRTLLSCHEILLSIVSTSLCAKIQHFAGAFEVGRLVLFRFGWPRVQSALPIFTFISILEVFWYLTLFHM
jgi:hypothetical protein